MKISSQLANNFDYCSAEIGEFFNQELFIPRRCGEVRLSALPRQ